MPIFIKFVLYYLIKFKYIIMQIMVKFLFWINFILISSCFLKILNTNVLILSNNKLLALLILSYFI